MSEEIEDAKLKQVAATLESLALRVDRALEELHRAVLHDPDTGLLSRGHLEERLEHEVKRARRFKKSLSVIVVEVADLPGVAARYGPNAALEALYWAAAYVKHEVREVDCPCRYGERQLAVILPETPAAGATVVANRIRNMMATHPVTLLPGERITLSVRVGQATCPDDAQAAGPLLAAAAQNLQR